MNNERGYGVSLSRNQTAVGLMLGYAVLMSFVPLFVAYGAGNSPFIFSAATIRPGNQSPTTRGDQLES